MATPTGLTPAPSTAFANSLLTGTGSYGVYSSASPSSYIDSKAPKWSKLSSFEVLTPEQQSKIERLLAYTFDIAPSLVKRFFSNLSCVQWSEAPDFIDGLPKYLSIDNSCMQVWRDFFEQMSSSENGSSSRRICLLFCKVSEDIITALGEVPAIKKIWATGKILQDSITFLNRSLRERVSVKKDLELSFINSNYSPENAFYLKNSNEIKKKIIGDLAVLEFKLSIWETTVIESGSSSTLVMGHSTWTSSSCNYVISGSNVYTTPTVMHHSAPYYYRVGVDTPAKEYKKWNTEVQCEVVSLEDDKWSSLLVVPPETREFLQFPTRYFDQIGVGPMMITSQGLKRVNKASLPAFPLELRSDCPVQPKRALAAISKITGLSEQIIAQENLNFELLEFANAGHILHGFFVEAEMTYAFMEQCLIPLLAKYQVFRLDLMACPPRPHALLPFLNNFSKHYVQELILTCPMTMKEEFAFAEQSQEVLKRLEEGAKFGEYILYILNPYQYHHSFKFLFDELDLENKVGEKSSVPLALFGFKAISHLPSIKASKSFFRKFQPDPDVPLVMGRNKVMTLKGIRQMSPQHRQNPKMAFMKDLITTPYALSLKAPSVHSVASNTPTPGAPAVSLEGKEALSK